ncbi:MAG: N-methyl-L-tryptophan oxidase [Phycisphaerales bacterium]|nr:N-methyl-L-tryptophan oxidase [Phycisphaerales bacterium]
MHHFDAVILGLGGIGSSALAESAARGVRVLGVDQFDPPHARGSSHGGSRVIRLAYFEHEGYVPLLRESFEAFDRLSRDAGVQLIHRTGLLQGGMPNNTITAGTLESARLHDLRVEALTGREASRRFPAFELPEAWELVYEHDAGFVRPEETIRVQLARARAAGAEIRTNTEVVGWEDRASSVLVRFADGTEVETGALVVCGGAWAPKLLHRYESLRAFNLKPTRQTILWLASRDATQSLGSFSTNAMPVWLFEDGEAGAPYGVPAFDGMGSPSGLKVGLHQHGGEAIDLANFDRTVLACTADAMLMRVARVVRAARDAAIVATATCLYTESHDGHFVIDTLSPESPNVIVATACNGHAFKFVPVIGRVIADAIGDRSTISAGSAAFLARGARG